MNKYEVTWMIPGDKADNVDIVNAESYSPNGGYVEFFTGSSRIASFREPFKVRMLSDETIKAAEPEYPDQEECDGAFQANLDLRAHVYDQYATTLITYGRNPCKLMQWHMSDGYVEDVHSLITNSGERMWMPPVRHGDPLHGTLLGFEVRVSYGQEVIKPTLAPRSA